MNRKEVVVVADTITTVNQADPVRAFEALARIIGEKREWRLL